MNNDTLSARFSSKIGQPTATGCIPWLAGKNKHGYGRIFSRDAKPGGGPVFAHHVAWTLARGPIPPGVCVLHACDNPGCVRVGEGHLFLGTQADNMRDMTSKRRDRNGRKTSCKRGHEFTQRNTLRASAGGRACRECHLAASRDAKRRARAAARARGGANE